MFCGPCRVVTNSKRGSCKTSIKFVYISYLITMAKFLKNFKVKGKKHEKSNDKDKQGGNPASTKKLDLDSLLKQDDLARSKKLQHYKWFHKGCNRRRAESALTKDGKHNGSFLVRENAAFDRDFVLSFVSNGKVEHYHIIENPQAPWVYSLDRGPPMDGLDVIVEHYRSTADGLPTTLATHVKGDFPPPLSVQCGYTNILHEALMDGNETLALTSLNHPKCPDVNDKDSSGSTALHLVSTHGLLEAATLLLEKGANPTTCDKEGYTPLHRACMENHSDIVTLLVQKGANAQYRHRGTGNVALHEAATKGNLESVRALLELCITCWPRNNDMKTPYELAGEFTHVACAKYIDNHKPPVASTSRKSWLHEGVTREKVAKLLEENGMTDGLFLVRTSASQPGCFVLSMSYEKTARNYKIDAHVTGACCVGNGPLLPSLEHLVEHYCMYQDGLPCILTKSISPDGSKMSMETVVEDYEQVVGNGFRAPIRINSVPSDLPPPPPSKAWLLPDQLPMERVLDRASIELGHELGQGEFGAVFKGIWTTPDGQKTEVAIKTLNEKHINTGKDNFLQEAKVMAHLDHPCIVKLIGVCMGNPLMMVQELVPLGCLLDYLLDYPENIANKDLFLWAAQIACGMMYLEKEGFVHRDLAARNILLATSQMAKVGDFGLSRAIGANSDYYRAAHSGKWPIKWYAPESVNYGTFSSSSDVWSYGVTLWEIFSLGEQPYENKSGAQVIKYIEHNGRLSRPPKCPGNVYQLMRRCWSFQATDRPTFEELHDIFSTDPEYETNRNVMQAILK